MALKNLVEEVNATLRTELADAEAHRESPRLLRILKALIRLTNSEEANSREPVDMPVPVCKHEHIGINGMCKDCDTQIFQHRNPGV